MSAAVKAPHVFRAINRITAAFAGAGMPKSRLNAQGQYHYRSIDDLLGRLGPLLAKHGLCVLPRVLLRKAEVRNGEAGGLLLSVRLLVAFAIVSARDGSRCTVRAWGEALDESDKGTAKAMSAAYKSAMLQLFCVPVAGEDADASSQRLRLKEHSPEPDQGWSTWAADIIDMIGICETSEALERVRNRQAGLLKALRSERPEFYRQVGEAFSRTQAVLSSPGECQPPPPKAPEPAQGKRGRGKKPEQAVLEPADG
ncbi:MAG TPA: ERF family protein [Sphingomicrobium sp.]|nr:ERF family protein [Sphingomicrobium sp.]